MGAKIPVASAASSSGSSSAQLTEMTATASSRSTPNSPSTFAAAVDVGRELAERAAHRRLPALGVGQHRRRRAVGPECGRAGHELVRAGGKPAIGERDPLDLGEVGGAAETGPQPLFGWFGVNVCITASSLHGS